MMTPEKAIKFFDEEIVRLDRAPIINGCEMTDDWRGHLEICKLAKAALEKQIPKKPKLKITGTTGWNTEYRCPTCNGYVTKGYCWHCGQALDWSDQND